MPDLKAYQNITLVAEPTDENHLVTKSYLDNNFLSIDSVAPAYASGTMYAVGDLVVYNGGLYRCTTAGTSNLPSTLSGWAVAYLTDLATSTTYGLVRPNSASFTVSNGITSLRTATASVLGGIKVGDGVSISSGTLSVSWGRKKTLKQLAGTVALTDLYAVYCVAPLINTTISFTTTGLTASTSTYSIEFTLILVQPSTAITFTMPSTVTWLGDQPSLDEASTAYIIEMRSYNGGTSWFASYKGSVASNSIALS